MKHKTRWDLARTGELTNITEYPDGSVVAYNERVRAWVAAWEDGTPLRGDNDELSYFKTREEAVSCLEEGKATSVPPEKRDIIEILRSMSDGEVRSFAARIEVRRVGPDEFRINDSLPMSYPNASRFLRSLGLEEVCSPR